MSKNKGIPKNAAGNYQTTIPLTTIKAFGLDTSSNDKPYISLKYIQTTFECFSDWSQAELKDFSSLINKMYSSNWTDIWKSGGKGENKTGFGMTIHKNKKVLPNLSILDRISPEIDFFELRVNQKSPSCQWRNRLHVARSLWTL